MATPIGQGAGDARRAVSSPRPKGRENAKNTQCRNVSIYGYCRYENEGCSYNHDRPSIPQLQPPPGQRFNVDSPSFTPLQTAPNGFSSSSRGSTISPKAANAAVFTPKTNKAPTLAPPIQVKDTSSQWATHDFPEFIPQGYDQSHVVDQNMGVNPYDPFTIPAAVSSLSVQNQSSQVNPYAQDTSSMGSAAFYQNNENYAQPLQYHLYNPLGPHRENLLAYQRTAHDFFLADDLREDLTRKAAASRQTLPNSSLPPQVDYFHSLVPLDTNPNKNATLFGYPSWVYKAVSSKDGFTYTLRRLEGYRLTDEKAIREVQPWKRIRNAGVVTVHDAFTTRAFGDSSLIFVLDYHPLSKTLAEQHFQYAGNPVGNPRFAANARPAHVPEQVIWGYIVQLASALKAIHAQNIAARLIHSSKVIITSKSRIRLNACAILDVVQHDTPRTMTDLQQDDLIQLGKLILCLASNSASAVATLQKSVDNITRLYTQRLKDCVIWLLSPPPAPSTPQSPTGSSMQIPTKDIDTFLTAIAPQLVSSLDSALHAEDALLSSLSRELENSRLFRLSAKLQTILERDSYEHNAQWSETGERYILKLFRDYVFHQVDAQGKPVAELGHVVGALNKLDTGTEEKICLVSRDEQSVFVVSYREVRRAIEGAWADLMKGAGSIGGAQGRR
ncbi:PAB-dependent poly(A)-specific ribonuclease subunit PAN3 [Aulographum hederae CBS 113979]|uniref:PAN2-PAN3 deadenylation complex subunit PAN3 n=1 Tax=Aulographum hederae CBS 113979 TaxID=1176131 RepID=A0A6G1GZK3_9PEZI|nr:PAB-dependent poly(A)-specific ribonuclease subunit PAN3 [Aulographum hederae CBS 113979]